MISSFSNLAYVALHAKKYLFQLPAFSKSRQIVKQIPLNVLIEDIPIITINKYVVQTSRLNSQAFRPSIIHKTK
jgi:hypothetical protein